MCDEKNMNLNKNGIVTFRANNDYIFMYTQLWLNYFIYTRI